MGRGPTYTITNNTKDFSTGYENDGKSDRNPSWVVAFFRFAEPVSMYAKGDIGKINLSIIENDCISVKVSRPKGSLSKSAELILKVGELYYPNMVAPGDWVMIWMANFQEDIDRIINNLKRLKASYSFGAGNGNPLNGWDSGLKFVGKVVSSGQSDTVSSNGARAITDMVSCRSNTELDSSVYYTFISQYLINPTGSQNSAVVATNFIQQSVIQGLAKGLDEGYRALTHDEKTPDMYIALLYILLLGVDNTTNIANSIGGVQGSPNDSIKLPSLVGTALGVEGATEFWQIFDYYGGIQQWKTGKNFKESYTPITKSSNPYGGDNFYISPLRCRGFIPFAKAPIWDNRSIWSIMSQYLSPVSNEMFTSLRYNSNGTIRPSITVREVPLGTRLLGQYFKNLPLNVSYSNEKENEPPFSPNQSSVLEGLEEENQTKIGEEPALKDVVTGKAKAVPHASIEEDSRTMFCNVPRWHIREKRIIAVDVATDASRRINYVAVWGNSSNQGWYGIQVSQETLLASQLIKQNYVSDQADIKRHGLRADVSNTTFDTAANKSGTLTPILARLRADWYFNNQHKLYGTITCTGITEPICEGDNLMIRGILYHIESISFMGKISASGSKSFITSIRVSNGMIASSVDSPNIDTLPAYTILNGYDRFDGVDLGVTDMQLTSHSNRDNQGNKK